MFGLVTAIFHFFSKKGHSQCQFPSCTPCTVHCTADNQYSLYNKPITRQNKTYLIYTSGKNIHGKSKEQELDQGFKNDI